LLIFKYSNVSRVSIKNLLKITFLLFVPLVDTMMIRISMKSQVTKELNLTRKVAPFKMSNSQQISQRAIFLKHKTQELESSSWL
jgi:hypothetical protein